MGVRQATFFRWNQVFGNVIPSEDRQLKQLQKESLRLRKLVSDLACDKEGLAEVTKKELSRPSQDAR